MNVGELAALSAAEISAAYAAGDVTPTDVVADVAAAIDAVNPTIDAFAELWLDEALEESKVATKELRAGRSLGPLHGVPIAVKELFDVRGKATSYGSVVFRDHRPREDAVAVSRLRAVGAIVIGSTRSHEFAWGITSQHATLGSVRNPWNLDRVPGGSSGGSGAAVASGLVPIALGTDTGGSVRIPAAYCGVVGLKPTFGRISTRGVLPLAPSLDHVGVLARKPEDCLIAVAAMAGYDELDLFSRRDLPHVDDYRGVVEPRALRISHSDEDAASFLSEDYRNAFDRLLAALSDAGCQLEGGRGVDRSKARVIFGRAHMPEAYRAHNVTLGTFPSRRADYGPDIAGRLDAAAKVTVEEHLDGLHGKREITRALETALDSADLLLTPIVGGSPSAIVDPEVVHHNGTQIEFRELVLGFSGPQDLAGLPACTIHCGLDSFGVPIAFQLTAARGRESFLMESVDALNGALESRGMQQPGLAPLRTMTSHAEVTG